MLPVSACIITLDEERNIRACLESVAFVDEVVVVDSRSADRTVEICREFTDRVIVRDFPGHVEQKNHAVGEARNDWVLCVDADERVSEALRASIEAALAADPGDVVGFEFARASHYLGRWMRRGGWYPDTKLRLFRRSRGRWGGENPHDHVRVDGPVRRLEGDLLHYVYDDLAHHLRVIGSYSGIQAREKFAKGVRPGWRLVTHPPAKFLKAYLLRGGVLEGWRGFLMAWMGAISVFMKYARLWELHAGDAARRHDLPPGDRGR
ncbi:MAG: glycosyltransferase family 2 protein [Planctomycetes bacterium]|nr:glycosyltransferase family 2 protein [Planctomycetota bacterium]